MNDNRRAFLDMIGYAELGPDLLRRSDSGYNVLVGGTLFDSYADHPRIVVELKRKGKASLYSSAAGRYQILTRIYDSYKGLLKLTDFSPAAQDAIALRIIRERGALPDIDAGRLMMAIDKCKNIWASLPGAGYGQPEHEALELALVYLDAGGQLV